jgi:transcriptional accessory protein Tex/SPT6
VNSEQRLKQKADEEAIAVFAENLRQLLLSSPLGSKKSWRSIPDTEAVVKWFAWMKKVN